uniref:Sde2_N_Ubi domain-containing protein n=1 Tax=Anopheles atroparvus TaxID=41427 RepID=A0A182IYB4_ANOAO
GLNAIEVYIIGVTFEGPGSWIQESDRSKSSPKKKKKNLRQISRSLRNCTYFSLILHKLNMFSILHGSALLQLSIKNDASNEIPRAITNWTGLISTEYYLTQNGRPVSRTFSNLLTEVPVRVNERLLGGKGGFGSMLRAIGAQIEKTTNREACRDLSGRRLRDINEEKRLKAYLEKQQEASEDERVKMQKKIEKLLAKPKHEFEDKEYEHQRSELIVETDDALQVGLQKVAQSELPGSMVKDCSERPLAGKRKRPEAAAAKLKKKKTTLWLGNDDLSSSSEPESDSGEDSVASNEAKAPSDDNIKQSEKKAEAASDVAVPTAQQTPEPKDMSATSDRINKK